MKRKERLISPPVRSLEERNQAIEIDATDACGAQPRLSSINVLVAGLWIGERLVGGRAFRASVQENTSVSTENLSDILHCQIISTRVQCYRHPQLTSAKLFVLEKSYSPPSWRTPLHHFEISFKVCKSSEPINMCGAEYVRRHAGKRTLMSAHHCSPWQGLDNKKLLVVELLRQLSDPCRSDWANRGEKCFPCPITASQVTGKAKSGRTNAEPMRGAN